eukprot:TRINITY_DN271_c0_g4_i1.p1 TRINITY_DN271_c0_g4~~TRINITY_DN271_c0_g4_i1.p1  ORF type:complete len:281 (+),score=53.17 TRINITY_DN271_c0_g4_i1:71-913(+)
MAKKTRQEPAKKVEEKVVEKASEKKDSSSGGGFRPVDYTLAGVYGFLAGASLWSLFMGCKGNAPTLPVFGPHCGAVASVDPFPVLSELHKTWNAEVFRVQKSDAVEYLHFVSIFANIFALPLMFACLLGPKGNRFQKYGLIHATTLIITNTYFFMAGLKSNPTQKDVFNVVYSFQVALPVLLLLRWMRENPFERQSNGLLSGFLTLIFKFGSVLALIYTLIIVYEWVISSHRDFKGYQKISPHFDETLQQASYHIAELTKVATEKAQDIGKIVTAKVTGQ